MQPHSPASLLILGRRQNTTPTHFGTNTQYKTITQSVLLPLFPFLIFTTDIKCSHALLAYASLESRSLVDATL